MAQTPRKPGEVYFEFRQIGNYLRCAAIDAATGREVVVSGPVNYGTEHLKRVALLKLEYVLSKEDN